MSEGELILCSTEDGAATIGLRGVDGTVWLSQRGTAELFDKDVRIVNEHIRNVFAEGECDPGATIRKLRIVQTEGSRQVEREVDAHNLDVIVSVGYRVRSARGTQFRRWATTVLREYLVKDFAMDDARLKEAEQWDYFDEWLARIRDIRASEKRFYQKQNVRAGAGLLQEGPEQDALGGHGQDGRRTDRKPQRSRGAEHGPDQLERLGRAQGRCRHRQELPQVRGGRGAQPHSRDVPLPCRGPGAAPPPRGRVGRQARAFLSFRRADPCRAAAGGCGPEAGCRAVRGVRRQRRAAEALAADEADIAQLEEMETAAKIGLDRGAR